MKFLYIFCNRNLLLSIFSILFCCNIQAQNQINNIIWEGVGGKKTWINTEYILFIVKGNETSTIFSGSRKFLLNKANGEVRFEGKSTQNDNYIILFNYKSRKLKKVFKNKILLKGLDDHDELFQSLLVQLNEDTSLLFIQTYLDKAGSSLGKSEQKISHSEKLIAIPFKTVNLLNKSLIGKIFLNKESHQVRNLSFDNEDYLVDGHKDIGGGLTLPTIFKNTANISKSCTYTLVASFTEMEEAKFSTL